MNINLFTWNICFGCMTNNTPLIDKTGGILAKLCKENAESGIRQCKENTKDVISTMISQNADFIFLQEASNHLELIQNSYEFSSGIVTGNIQGTDITYQAEIATMYNTKKYMLITTICGDLNEKEGGRPYLISIFYVKSSNSFIVTINCHFPQDVKSLYILKTVENFNGATINSKIKSLVHINIIIKNSPIIIGGDFNDRADKYALFSKKFILFDHFFNSISKPDDSCCSGKNTLRWENPTDNKTSDYFRFSSTNEWKIIYQDVNIRMPEFDVTIPTSDHIPIKATIVVEQHNQRNIGYDFDGVLHNFVFYDEGKGDPKQIEGHPGPKYTIEQIREGIDEKGSVKKLKVRDFENNYNRCFTPITNKVFTNFVKGYKQFIITARQGLDEHMTKILTNCLKKFNKLIFPDSHIRTIGGQSSKSTEIISLQLDEFYEDSPKKLIEIFEKWKNGHFKNGFQLYRVFTYSGLISPVLEEKDTFSSINDNSNVVIDKKKSKLGKSNKKKSKKYKQK